MWPSTEDVENVGEYTYVSFNKQGFTTIEEAEDWVEQKIEENSEDTDIVENLTYSYDRGRWSARLHLTNRDQY